MPTRPFWPNLSSKETLKEWILGNGLLDKDNTKQNPTKQMSKKLTWLTHKHLFASFFMNLIVSAPKGSEL
jgi:hypothetical protein